MITWLLFCFHKIVNGIHRFTIPEIESRHRVNMQSRLHLSMASEFPVQPFKHSFMQGWSGLVSGKQSIMQYFLQISLFGCTSARLSIGETDTRSIIAANTETALFTSISFNLPPSFSSADYSGLCSCSSGEVKTCDGILSVRGLFIGGKTLINSSFIIKFMTGEKNNKI